MTREQQIINAAIIEGHKSPPVYSELVMKARKLMSAYEIGFAEGALWADENPNWISVEDELPAEEGRYIVCNKHGHVIMLDYEDGEWQSELLVLHDITHWMPLPGLPKEHYNVSINIKK